MKRKQLKYVFISALLFLLLLFSDCLTQQQISVGRIEQLSAAPSDYFMRPWRRTAQQYDSLVFNQSASGDYLPLIFINSSGYNYPHNPSFGLHSYVGTLSPASGEAINALPALVGATLSGIDKTSQYGRNWVRMAADFFNRKNELNLYLNHPSTSTGSDWWYETMPNVFFYQLNYLYPSEEEFFSQFSMVAARWLQAVRGLGGGTAPWRRPNMNYRSFNFSTMKPNASGVPEPEAAGAIAWIEYMAFVKTGNKQYRAAAEQSMEFLNSLSSNPSYELQLPYGVLAAARMNAELGTNYDIAKLFGWCFEVGPLRSWGMMTGKWGDHDVGGLIGEVNGSNDYAFLMNTFQLAGAITPSARYDDRLARSVGKWLLHAASAARLFYWKFLPDQFQDSEEWAKRYDINSAIGYEALLQRQFAYSPFATGDAVKGGWSKTNLSLYSSSHAGMLGSILDTTDVRMILKIDLLKTDFYHQAAYPSFLYYNPYSSAKTVSLDAGAGQYDIYEAVSNAYIGRSVSGNVSFTIAPDAAIIIVLIPAGALVSYEMNKMIAGGVMADFNAGVPVENYPPRIKSLASADTILLPGGITTIYCSASDRENDAVVYQWGAKFGLLTPGGDTAVYKAPEVPGTYYVACRVTDAKGAAEDSIAITVKDTSATGIEDGSIEVPDEDMLFQNYPNPFNSSTTYSFFIRSGGTVSLSIYDVLGRRMARIIEAFRPEGFYRIQGGPEAVLPGGVYFLVLSTPSGARLVKKMVMIK